MTLSIDEAIALLLADRVLVNPTYYYAMGKSEYIKVINLDEIIFKLKSALDLMGISYFNLENHHIYLKELDK